MIFIILVPLHCQATNDYFKSFYYSSLQESLKGEFQKGPRHGRRAREGSVAVRGALRRVRRTFI